MPNPGQPARRIVSRSPHRSVGIVSCSWLQSWGIEYESQLERRFIQCALVFPFLHSVIHQPFKISYLHEGQERQYTPDFICNFTDGSRVVIEVKPKAFVPKHQPTLSAAATVLGSSGVPFSVCTDKELGKSIATNAATILRYTRGAIPHTALGSCVAFLAERRGSASLAELLLGTGIPLNDVLHLIGRHSLSIPSLSDINPTVTVSIPQLEMQHAYILFLDWLGLAEWPAAT